MRRSTSSAQLTSHCPVPGTSTRKPSPCCAGLSCAAGRSGAGRASALLDCAKAARAEKEDDARDESMLEAAEGARDRGEAGRGGGGAKPARIGGEWRVGPEGSKRSRGGGSAATTAGWSWLMAGCGSGRASVRASRPCACGANGDRGCRGLVGRGGGKSRRRSGASRRPARSVACEGKEGSQEPKSGEHGERKQSQARTECEPRRRASHRRLVRPLRHLLSATAPELLCSGGTAEWDTEPGNSCTCTSHGRTGEVCGRSRERGASGLVRPPCRRPRRVRAVQRVDRQGLLLRTRARSLLQSLPGKPQARRVLTGSRTSPSPQGQSPIELDAARGCRSLSLSLSHHTMAAPAQQDRKVRLDLVRAAPDQVLTLRRVLHFLAVVLPHMCASSSLPRPLARLTQFPRPQSSSSRSVSSSPTPSCAGARALSASSAAPPSPTSSSSSPSSSSAACTSPSRASSSTATGPTTSSTVGPTSRARATGLPGSRSTARPGAGSRSPALDAPRTRSSCTSFTAAASCASLSSASPSR